MSESSADKNSRHSILRLAVDVVAAYVGRNELPANQISNVLQSVFASLNTIGESAAAGRGDGAKPAVPVAKSVFPDYLVCLEDGMRMKMLKRHLRTRFKMTPEQYRAKWGLPADYPMVAPNYAAERSQFAKKIGLGRKPTTDRRARRTRPRR